MTPRGFSRIDDCTTRRSGARRASVSRFWSRPAPGTMVFLREVKSLLGYEADADLLFEPPVSETLTRKFTARGTRFGPVQLLD